MLQEFVTWGALIFTIYDLEFLLNPDYKIVLAWRLSL